MTDIADFKDLEGGMEKPTCFGSEICEHCGSLKVTQRGFEETNHRHECLHCKKTTVVLRL